MAITITYDAKQGTNKRIGAALARGKKFISGALNFSGQTYATGGITCSFVGFTTLDSVWLQNQDGQVLRYIDSTGKVAVDGLASGVNVGSWTAVKFLAVGD